jgi:hypothetical protein
MEPILQNAINLYAPKHKAQSINAKKCNNFYVSKHNVPNVTKCNNVTVCNVPKHNLQMLQNATV